MGVFQKGINNILAEAAIGATLAKDTIQKNEEKKLAANKAESEAKQAEAESINMAQETLNDALQMSIGYTAKDVRKQKAGKALGLPDTGKMPRGVSKATFDRRSSNAKAMQEILNKYVQNKDFRERISKYSAKDISAALNPQIRTRKSKGIEVKTNAEE